MVHIRFHRLATKEYRAALRWYARRDPQVAQRFEDELDRIQQSIAEAPDRWPVILKHFRWLKTHRFPYLVCYHIEHASHVLIIAVAHAKRRPGYWRRRLEY
jgi:plasmid stabilization system protein ParE